MSHYVTMSIDSSESQSENVLQTITTRAARQRVWKQPKSLVQALAYKKGMGGGKWALNDKENKYFVSQGEQNGHSSRTHTVIPHNLITFRLQASDVT